MNKKNIATGVVILAALAGLAAIATIVVFTAQNDSGHTSVNPYLALALFVPVAVAGILHLTFLRSSGAARWCAILAVVIAIAGTGLLIYLDQSNMLLQYDVWCERGMP